MLFMIRKMLVYPSCSKTILFTMMAIIFFLYYKEFQIGDNILSQHLLVKKAVTTNSFGVNEGKDKILPPVMQVHKPYGIALNLSFEASIQQDLGKQNPSLGAMGNAAYLEGAAKKRGEKIYKKIGLNEELSEHISYNRTLADYRHSLCTKKHFDVNGLPSASVIVIFYNEPYSALLRTVHSTLNTCVDRLLKEIILVDDGSTNVELREKLDYYIRTRIPSGKVSVIRLKNRLGLIRARLAGARTATADVLIFLDAHCEANIGWCEPLLQRIKESRTSVLLPIIDSINARNFKYTTHGTKKFKVGGFLWSGEFDWIDVSHRERARLKRECKESDLHICATYSPTMAGGLFAIDRDYFWKIGSYDEKMDGWGGENLEISFRVWQCGGTIETIPCSRVGHIFRSYLPYDFPNDRDIPGINTARMALVWMDEYINLFHINRPDLKNHPDIGDVTHRIALRKKMHCKSFDWYLKNIYPEKFIPTKNVIAYGRVRSIHTNFCLDDLQQHNDDHVNLAVSFCKLHDVSQFFSLTTKNVLRNEFSCASVQYSDSPPHLILMGNCYNNDDLNDKWQYESYTLKHLKTGLCLDHKGLRKGENVQLSVCNRDSMTQNWAFRGYQNEV